MLWNIHGTRGRYAQGCRCEPCRKGNSIYQREFREALKERPREEVPHGTRGGYTNWGCRCELCSQVSAEENRPAVKKYYAKIRAARIAAKAAAVAAESESAA